MPHYRIAEHQQTHTCPANPHPHPITTAHTVLAVEAAGPCLRPVTIRCGPTTAVVACGRHEPASRHCDNCATTITIVSRTTGPYPLTRTCHPRGVGELA